MSLKKALTRQENQMAFFVAWIVFPIVATLAGFYMGTFFASEHVIDMQPKDIENGWIGAGIGFAVAMLTAIFVTVTYPKVIEREYEEREAHDREMALAHSVHH
jgi:magnesium-transporting ATPase (P-type)